MMRWNTLHSFYTSPEWAEAKAQLLLERGDTCECGCGKVFKGSWDCIPHHIKEITLDNVHDYSISLNPDNLILLRHICHNRKHGRFQITGHRKVYLVHGSPCSGKSDFVRENAMDEDLIIDLDALRSAVCVGNSPATRGDIFALRDLLLDRVATRAGKWTVAWVVGAYPIKGERERLLDRLGAEGIHINTGKDECLSKATDSLSKDWVRDYFASFQA